MTMNDFLQLAELCRGHNVFIQTHNFPDPDAIASAFGLQRLLKRYGVPSTLCYDGRIDKLSSSKMVDAFHIEMVPSRSLQGVMDSRDPIICVDTQKNGGNVTDLIGDEVACIDHHPTCVPVEYRWQDIRAAGACASLVAQYYDALGVAPETDVATALLYGIKMDTLQFTQNVSELDIGMFAFLHPLCDQKTLFSLERNNMELEDLRAYGAAIQNIRVYRAVGFSWVPFSCPDAMLAILADFILSLVEVEVAVVFSRREDGVKFSVRSEDPAVHAGELTRAALRGLGDGGGHAVMAGGLIPEARTALLGPHPGRRIRELFLEALGRDGGAPASP